jgi:hypothetical protein
MSFLKSLQIIKSNKQLLKIYTESIKNGMIDTHLYQLSKGNQPDYIQLDYNRLHNKLKYHSIILNGIPISLIVLDYSLYKNISIKISLD